MRSLMILIVKYLRRQLESGHLTPDAAEGIEVAAQCIESAYNILPYEIRSSSSSLEELYLRRDNMAGGRSIPEELKSQAETLKLLGNNLMKLGQYEDAMTLYSKAIDIDRNNAVYFCNRAAAFIKLSILHEAIKDCEAAIRIDPNYSKAHSRLGYAYSAMGNHVKAKECYQRALEIDPNNPSYRASLLSVEEQLASSSSRGPDVGGLMPGLDMGAFFRNPNFMSVASQMLADPAMQNVVSRLLSNQSLPSLPLGNVEELITAGQQLADRLQQQAEATLAEVAAAGGAEGDNRPQPVGNEQPTQVPDLRPEGDDEIQATESASPRQDLGSAPQDNVSKQLHQSNDDMASSQAQQIIQGDASNQPQPSNDPTMNTTSQQAPEQQQPAESEEEIDEMNLFDIDFGGSGDALPRFKEDPKSKKPPKK